MPIRFSLNLQNLPEFIARILVHIVMFVLAFLALREFFLGFKSESPVTGIIGFLIGLAYSFFAALCFTYLYLDRFSEKFVDGLFGGKKYLKKPPRTYGILTGLIAEQKYEEAVANLNSLLTDEKCRRDPHLLRIVLDFYVDDLHQPEAAWEFGAAFFRQKPLPEIKPEENLRALLLLDDLAAELGKHDETREIMQIEFAKRRMPKHDLNVLARRLAS